MWYVFISSLLCSTDIRKSTTIKLLTGLYGPDSGDALVGGYSIVDEMHKVREVIGVCPQDNILWDFLTVREHMQFFANIVGVHPDSANQHIDQLLEEVGLAPKADIISKSLSGGMKRKLMLAMALTGTKVQTYDIDPFCRDNICWPWSTQVIPRSYFWTNPPQGWTQKRGVMCGSCYSANARGAASSSARITWTRQTFSETALP